MSYIYLLAVSLNKHSFKLDIMKWIFSLLTLYISISSEAQVENTSYVNKSTERVLQLSIVVPLEVQEVWKYFSTDAKLSEWIAPIAHIELKMEAASLLTMTRRKHFLTAVQSNWELLAT